MTTTKETTEVWKTTSKPTSPTNQSEEGDGSKTAIYVGVTVAVIAVLLITVTIFLVSRRHKRRKRQDTDSEAIYSGNDMLTRNRRPVPGIENQAYFNHVLESQENDLSSDNTISNSDQCRQVPIKDNTPVLITTHNYNNINVKTEKIQEDTYEYNQKVVPAKDESPDQYSYVTNGPGGFKVFDDTSYSYITCQNETQLTKKTLMGNNTGRIRRKSHSTSELKADKYENISGYFEDLSSVYDHAVAGGRDPDVKREDKDFFINGTKENQKKNMANRHSYVNVKKENDLGQENNLGLRYDHVEINGQNPGCIIKNEYNHLNEVNGRGIISPGHKYVNITKGNEDPGTSDLDNRYGDYEEAVGRTPTYFVIEP